MSKIYEKPGAGQSEIAMTIALSFGADFL